MMTTTGKLSLFTLALGLAVAGCTNDVSEVAPGTNGDGSKPRFIISATPVGSQGVADYLLTTDTLTQGTISTRGAGIEQDGTYRYYITHKNRFFSLLYGQGNPGAVTTYTLNATGKLEKVSDFQAETVQVFAPVNNDILTMRIPRTGTESALAFRINADSSKVQGQSQINIVQLAGNGERAHFTWATQVGNKVYAPYMSIKGAAPDAFGTSYPDSAWVAVLSYPSLTVEKVIRDNRTSFIGRYFTNGLTVDEQGDVYAFSSGVATNSNQLNSTKPSAITRIKSGTTEFDRSYLFNVEQASGGANLNTHLYIGQGNYILTMTNAAEKGAYNTGKRVAVVNVYNQTFKWVEGMPTVDEIVQLTSGQNNYSPKDGRTGFIGLTLTDGSSYIYQVDATTARATRGLKIEGGTITAINRLSYN
ncbi:DUF4374 domain-containing protein [Spirosoma rhododendri]|uniref:DUF4374 domain-containing protein n=1 Tax=Spirosoma rhododendri TaxID=2728024 RepID=A0A7L5DL10_9BACT|nr:DUF4374 domain-containing protein [Spirosoma rhododendri]QJD77098.1 DUF4374 domain-containing protein [Spirosoma rhododendri]